MCHVARAVIDLDDHCLLLGCKGSAVIEPGLRCKKDKSDDQKAENIILPGPAFVFPFDHAFHLSSLHYMPVAHLDRTRTSRRSLRIVRDHDDRLVKFLI